MASRSNRASRIARDYRSPLDVVLMSKEEKELLQRRLVSQFSRMLSEEREKPVNEAEQLDGCA